MMSLRSFNLVVVVVVCAVVRMQWNFQDLASRDLALPAFVIFSHVDKYRYQTTDGTVSYQ
jgi:hypothetical protein